MSDWLTDAALRFEGLTEAQIAQVDIDIPIAADIIGQLERAINLPLVQAAPVISAIIPKIIQVIPTLKMVVGAVETEEKEHSS